MTRRGDRTTPSILYQISINDVVVGWDVLSIGIRKGLCSVGEAIINVDDEFNKIGDSLLIGDEIEIKFGRGTLGNTAIFVGYLYKKSLNFSAGKSSLRLTFLDYMGKLRDERIHLDDGDNLDGNECSVAIDELVRGLHNVPLSTSGIKATNPSVNVNAEDNIRSQFATRFEIVEKIRKLAYDNSLFPPRSYVYWADAKTFYFREEAQPNGPKSEDESVFTIDSDNMVSAGVEVTADMICNEIKVYGASATDGSTIFWPTAADETEVDMQSIKKYGGRFSAVYKSDLSNTDDLQAIARRVLFQHKEAKAFNSVTATEGEWLGLNQIITVDGSAYGYESEEYRITEMQISFSAGNLTVKFTVDNNYTLIKRPTLMDIITFGGIKESAEGVIVSPKNQNLHRLGSPLDHPDRSVTRAKMAASSVGQTELGLNAGVGIVIDATSIYATGGYAENHAPTHHSGGADEVYYASLERSSGDSTTHDDYTNTPHISASDRTRWDNKEYEVHGSELHNIGTPTDVAATNVTGTGGNAVRHDHQHRGITSIARFGGTTLYGACTFVASTSITLSQSGQKIRIASTLTESTSVSTITAGAEGTTLYNDITLSEGTGINIVVNGQDIRIDNDMVESNLEAVFIAQNIPSGEESAHQFTSTTATAIGTPWVYDDAYWTGTWTFWFEAYAKRTQGLGRFVIELYDRTTNTSLATIAFTGDYTRTRSGNPISLTAASEYYARQYNGSGGATTGGVVRGAKLICLRT
jgi:hypothetical protein